MDDSKCDRDRGVGMKDFITLLLAIMIFGPSITVNDKNGQLRFVYMGIICTIVQYVYWMVRRLSKSQQD